MVNLDEIKGYLSERWPEGKGMALLDRCFNENPKGLHNWIKGGSIAELRVLTQEFGDYWGSLEFQNTVDELDAAYAEVVMQGPTL